MVVMFEHDFEDGTFNGLTLDLRTPHEPIDNIAEIITDPATAYEGTRYAALTCDGFEGYEHCAMQTRFPDQNELTFTFPYSVSRLPIREDGWWQLFVAFAYGGSPVATIGIAWLRLVKSAGIPSWQFNYYKNGSVATVELGVPAALEWFVFKIHVTVGETDGSVELSINGAVVFSDGGFKNNDSGGMDRALFGFCDKSDTIGNPVTGFFDKITIETPEPPPPTYNLIIQVNDATMGYINPVVGTYTYNEGTSVPVEAFSVDITRYRFDHWELDGVDVGDTNPYGVNMDADHVILAVFVAEPSPPAEVGLPEIATAGLAAADAVLIGYYLAAVFGLI